MRPAAFLDRDGTIVEQVDHLTDPGDVRLLPGAAKGIRLLRSAGYACVVVTNQSVIGRGMLSVEGLEGVHQEMRRQLAQQGAELDGVYYCPVAPTTTDRAIVEHSDRKPGSGMLLRAAAEMNLDVSRSWMIGDMISDMLAGRHAGCMSNVLVQTGPGWQRAREEADYVVEDLPSAARLIISTGNGRSQL